MAHALLDESIKLREYQESAVAVALEQNTLVVLPTGMGKTMIALFVAAHRLGKFPESKILFLAPSKPLAQQHLESFKRALKLEDDEFGLFTGDENANKRRDLWSGKRVVVATPQTIENDIISGNISLGEVSLVVFDEAHRASGNYAYVFIAKEYAKRPDGLSLALTASPGANKEKIEEVIKNLNIAATEIKSDKDWDVRKYVERLEADWVKVPFPENFTRLKELLESAMNDYLGALKGEGYLVGKNLKNLGKRDLLNLQSHLRQEMQDGEAVFKEISMAAALIKLFHGLELLETQGISPLYEYFKRMQKQKSKAVASLLKRDDIRNALGLVELLHGQGIDHPKLEKLYEIIGDQIEKKSSAKVIVFTQYRDSVGKILDVLNKHDSIVPIRFIGQASKGKQKGMSQKEQKQIIEEFSAGEFNVLVATSVGEEGLDIPEVDLVVFYEPVPSAIRSIQRRGRTARRQSGRLIVLMTEKTRDETYFWAAFHKERRMKAALGELRTERSGKQTAEGQSRLDAFVDAEETDKIKENKLRVFVDQRERNSGISKALHELGLDVEVKQLDVADYIVSEDVCIERKTVSDFLQSMIDGRLMGQMAEMRRNFTNPLLVIEGDPSCLYTERNIHPDAIRGAMASIALNFQIPVLFTTGPEDSAGLIAVLAKREQDGQKKEVSLRGEKRAMSMAERQQFIVESLPNVSAVLAKRLLKHFGSVRAIVDAGSMELQKVEGVGSKKAQEIKKVLRAKYEE